MSKIILANSDAYNSSAFSQELTGYAAGYKAPDVTEALDFIAPPVPVPSKRFEFTQFGEGDLVVDTDDERAVYGNFKVVRSSGKLVTERLVARGLTLLLDQDEISANYEQRAVERLKRRLLRNELVRAAQMLAKAATNSAKKWMASGTGKSTPDGDLMDLVKSVADAGGMHANRILCGEQAWAYRYAAMVASEAPGEGASAKLTPEQVAQFLGVEEFKVSKERYETTDSSDGSKKKANAVSANTVFAFNASKGVDVDDPSTFKRFHLGDGFKVFVEDKGYMRAITVSHYSLLAQTGVGACKSITVSNA